MTRTSILFALAFAAAVVAVPAAATTPVGEPEVVFLPSTAAPLVPAGLKVTCMEGPNQLTPSKTCPVVQYNGYSVWAYSFIDNRVSLALVTYDSNNKVVGNITKNGTRYIWNAVSSLHTQGVEFFGQTNTWVTATWAELFPGMPANK